MSISEGYIAPARSRAALWRLVLGIIIVMVVWIGATVALVVGGTAYDTNLGDELARGASTPRALLLFLGTFGAMHLGVAFAARVLHKRSYASVLGLGLGSGRFARNLMLAIVAMVIITALPLALTPFEGVWFEDPPNIFLSTPVPVWLMWLVPAILATLLQTSAEEVMFRGYLLQQLAARFRSPWIWAVLPSIGFASLHFNPGALGVNTYVHMGNTFAAGVMLALITMRTGNLGAAIGLHFTNNLIGLVLVSPQGFLDGVALFSTDADLQGTYMAYGVAVQTAVEILAFSIWWRWMGRHKTAQV